ncbi:PepSY-associated TM helix domain-containing protein [Aurantivibrio infirmus]
MWREFASISRILHIYLSSCLFTLLILFCITGVVLNHLDWLDGTSTDGDTEFSIPANILLKISNSESYKSGDGLELIDIPLQDFQSILAAEFNLKSASSIDYDSDMKELIFDYQIPGGYAAAIVDLNENLILLEYRQGSSWSIMSDLHKGRHSGKAWSWVIDVSAILMIFFSITGILILFQNKKHRFRAMLFVIVGSITPLLIYFFWVPKLSGV